MVYNTELLCFWTVSIVWSVSSFPPSPEDGNRSSFRNVILSRIQDDGKSPKTQ
jgi:hypothetical protein